MRIGFNGETLPVNYENQQYFVSLILFCWHGYPSL